MPSAWRGERPAIEASDLSCSYVRGRTVLQHFDLTVMPGSICMVLGPSGSGKSTLLRALKGLVQPTAGTLSVFGVPVTAAHDRRRRRALQQSIAWIPQNLGLVRNATVMQNVLSGALGRVGTLASLAGVFPADVKQEALARLDSLGIGGKAGEKVFALSGGERQRVAIARALMQQPRLVLADEFVSHLDLVTTRDTMAIVAGIAQSGVTFLVTSHAVELAAEYGDKVVLIRDGRKVHEGTASAFTRASAVALMAR